MAEESRVSGYLIIILFAAAVAALGIRELQGRFRAVNLDSGRKNPNLIQQLHGVSSVERASFSPEAVEKMIEEDQRLGKVQKDERPALNKFLSKFFNE